MAEIFEDDISNNEIKHSEDISDENKNFATENSDTIKQTAEKVEKCFVRGFNIRSFTKEPCREGSEKDVKKINETFREIGCDTLIERNKNAEEMMTITKEWSKIEGASCFIFFLMSHGGKGYISASDSKKVKIQKLIKPIIESETLKGKPKLFIIEACRGKKEMKSIKHFNGSNQQCFFIPTESDNDCNKRMSDCLFAYSTKYGYL